MSVQNLCSSCVGVMFVGLRGRGTSATMSWAVPFTAYVAHEVGGLV